MCLLSWHSVPNLLTAATCLAGFLVDIPNFQQGTLLVHIDHWSSAGISPTRQVGTFVVEHMTCRPERLNRASMRGGYDVFTTKYLQAQTKVLHLRNTMHINMNDLTSSKTFDEKR